MKRWIGIDPGLNGGIALLDEGGFEPGVAVMPTIAGAKGKGREYNLRDIRDFIIGCMNTASFKAHVVIERQQPMSRNGKQGVTSTFSIGRGFGLLEGLCAGLGIPYEIVHPRTWQARMLHGMPRGDTKAASVLVAQRLFPRVRLTATDKCRVPHHGMADALLIAAYAMRSL